MVLVCLLRTTGSSFSRLNQGLLVWTGAFWKHCAPRARQAPVNATDCRRTSDAGGSAKEAVRLSFAKTW